MAHPNGQIPTSSLASVGNGQALEKRAAASWLRLVAAAKRDGITLALTDSYRPLAVQTRIFLDRYTPQRTGGGTYGDIKVYKNTRYVRKAGTASAATPGTSNHGSGIAVDIKGISSAYGGPRSAGYKWLAKHAAAYGWANPAWASSRNFWEPWHWEYNASADTKQVRWVRKVVTRDTWARDKPHGKKLRLVKKGTEFWARAGSRTKDKLGRPWIESKTGVSLYAPKTKGKKK